MTDTPTGTPTGAAATADADPDAAIIDAMMQLVAEQSLASISLADIAAAAGVGLSDLHRRFTSKRMILRAFTRRIDAAVLAGVDADQPDGTESARDRLFDVLMQRFDVLAPYKAAVRRLLDDGRRHPGGLVAQAGPLLGSMGWMLEAAGIDSAGPLGEMRKLALAGAYAASARTWLRDDSPDLATTMATLDRNLRRLENWTAPRRSGNSFQWPWRRGGQHDTASPADRDGDGGAAAAPGRGDGEEPGWRDTWPQ